jgi:GTP pyrophosphokinase
MKSGEWIMDIETLLSRVDNLPQSDLDLIRRAYDVALLAHDGQKRASGEPYIVHSLAVAQLLADLRLDAATIAAGLLHDVPEDTIVALDDLYQEFGGEVANLVDGVTKLRHIDQLSQISSNGLRDEKAESLRKMFLAMVDDVRVVLIKLADRMHNMRTLDALSEEKRRRIARETLEIFAPLANRLGIWQMKWELEDLGFRHLKTETYKEIAKLIDERRADRELYIENIINVLEERLEAEGIKAEVYGRPKHIYSIYRKMERKGVGFDQIYDIRAVRIVVNEIKDCYAALGIVHTLWSPIPGEFDDFIATPKDNMYRSLHTAVLAPGGRPLEVQIRTHEMHRTAEYGIAAHWRYKEQTKRDIVFENKIAWLRQLMEWRRDVTDAQEFVDALKTDVFQDRVYVFSPKGEVFDLPAASTPIDFAYQVHTEIGHRCRGAKVNGRLVALDYQLKSGDQVEILTAKRGGPSRDWLNPQLGYVKTSRARQKIRQWFRRQKWAENIARGREMLEKELKRLSLEQENFEEIAALFSFDKTDDFLAAVGYGDINPHQITAKVLEHREDETDLDFTAAPPPALDISGINVRGVGGVYTNLARCCNPLPGDDIVGYITRGRGVTIHRRDCPNVLSRSTGGEAERFIEVEWGRVERQTYPVAIKVRAWDRSGLLRDIATVVADEDVSLSAANVTTRKKENIATITATLEITGIVQLSRILAKVERLPNVLEARRLVS